MLSTTVVGIDSSCVRNRLMHIFRLATGSPAARLDSFLHVALARHVFYLWALHGLTGAASNH